MANIRKLDMKEYETALIKVAGMLHMEGWDEPELGVLSLDEDLKVMVDENILRIRNYSDCDIFVPPDIQLTVERVGGDAYIRDIPMEILSIQKVGGNLFVQNMQAVEISRVGGDCSLWNIQEKSYIDRVSGDLIALEAGGILQADTIRGDVVMHSKPDKITINSSGDVSLDLDNIPEEMTNIRSKGDIALTLPEGAGARLNVVSSSRSIQTKIAGTEYNDVVQSYSQSIGDGGPAINLKASGFVVITDEKDIESFLVEHFKDLTRHWEVARETRDRRYDPSQASAERAFRIEEQSAERQRRIARRIERRARKKAERLSSRLDRQAELQSEQLARLIELDIEGKVESALRVAEDALKRLEIKWDFDDGVSIHTPERPARPPRPPRPQVIITPPTPASTPPPPSAAVSADERKRVLEMLEQGKITAEQAVQLLEALSGK